MILMVQVHSLERQKQIYKKRKRFFPSFFLLLSLSLLLSNFLANDDQGNLRRLEVRQTLSTQRV